MSLNSTDSAFICIEMNSIVIFGWHSSTCDQHDTIVVAVVVLAIQMKSKTIYKSSKCDQTEPISLSDSNSECLRAMRDEHRDCDTQTTYYSHHLYVRISYYFRWYNGSLYSNFSLCLEKEEEENIFAMPSIKIDEREGGWLEWMAMQIVFILRAHFSSRFLVTLKVSTKIWIPNEISNVS